jgi:hypothetical protein
MHLYSVHNGKRSLAARAVTLHYTTFCAKPLSGMSVYFICG